MKEKEDEDYEFNFKNPKSEYEKLMVELVTCLNETNNVFIKLNSSNETFRKKHIQIMLNANTHYVRNFFANFLVRLTEKSKKSFLSDLKNKFNDILESLENLKEK